LDTVSSGEIDSLAGSFGVEEASDQRLGVTDGGGARESAGRERSGYGGANACLSSGLLFLFCGSFCRGLGSFSFGFLG
jgi:hypothetical protein